MLIVPRLRNSALRPNISEVEDILLDTMKSYVDTESPILMEGCQAIKA